MYNINELIHIIKGINFEGAINDKEILSLQSWVDENRNLSYEPSLIALIKLVEDVLEVQAIDDIHEDGSIGKDKQLQILDMLNTEIRTFQFDNKIEYLCKQVKARKNIGINLIDILNNEADITEIHRRAESQLIKALSPYSSLCDNQEIIVVSLVLIAMLEYDGNYYGSVRSTYTEVYSRYTEQKIEGLIRSILSRYKRRSDSGSRTRIINVALENAIVPQAFLSAFFEFIFDIYKINFEYDLPDEPYEDFKFVFEGLHSNTLLDGDGIDINVTQKTYKLIVATKQLMRQDGLDAVIELSIIIVNLIDKRFWDKEVKIFNPYLKVGYEGWEKQLKEKAHGSREHRASSSVLKSCWEPKYVMSNNAVYLAPPAHKVKTQYDYHDIAVIVLNDGEEIYRKKDCFIKEIIGGYQVNPPNIEIDKPLGKIAYRLVCGDEIIYDSKEKLHRNCIVFNEHGEEINNNTDFEGTVYIYYKAGDAEIQNILTREHYCIGYKLVRLGDAIGIGNDVFNFSSMVKPGVFGHIHKNCFVRTSEKRCLLVYKEVNVVTFEADNISNKFEVIINGKSHKLSDMKYKTTLRGSITKYVIELGLINSGIYFVEVNQIVVGKKNKILKEAFVYDAELSYKSQVVDDDCYRVKINSGIIAERIDTEVMVDNFELEIIRFKYDDEECGYLLPLNLGFYSLDGGAWNYITEELWIDDISLESTIRLFDSECNGLLIYTEDGSLAEDNVVVKDKGSYKEISIGFLNSYNNGSKNVLLVFTVDGRKKYEMICYNKCVIDKDGTEILFWDNPKQIIITPVFNGKNCVFFEIFNKSGEKIYTSKALKSGQSEAVQEFNSFEEYTINFHEKTKTLMLRKNTLLFAVNKTFYAKKDYVGKVFKIDVAYFDQFIRGNYTEKTYHFNKTYVRIADALTDTIFEGQFFVKTLRGEWELDRINPVEVEICSEVIDDTMDVYITNCGDGLLLDFKNHGVLNDLEHPTAPDIFLYTLRMKSEV